MLCGALGIGSAQLMLPRGPVRSMGAASRPYSINAAVWTAFVAVNGVCMHCRQDLFLKIQETRHATVCVSFGSLMVQRYQWDTSWGAKKINFLIRDIDDAIRAGASMESYRFVVLRSPRGRLGSKYTWLGTTAHAWPLPAYFGQFSQPSNPLVHELLGNGFQKPSVGPSAGVCGAGDYPLPDLPRETSRSRSAPEKSGQFGPDGAPFP